MRHMGHRTELPDVAPRPTPEGTGSKRRPVRAHWPHHGDTPEVISLCYNEGIKHGGSGIPSAVKHGGALLAYGDQLVVLRPVRNTIVSRRRYSVLKCVANESLGKTAGNNRGK